MDCHSSAENLLSAENQSEASCSFTTQNGSENPLKRKRTNNVLGKPRLQPNEMPRKKRRTEIGQKRVKCKTGSRSVRRINRFRKDRLSAVNQSEASCSFTEEKSNENPLKRKRMDDVLGKPKLQPDELQRKRRRTEIGQNRVKKYKKRSRSVRRINRLPKAGRLLAENRLEASCSFTARKGNGNIHLRRQGTESRRLQRINPLPLEHFYDSYIIGELLGKGAFSTVYAGVRKLDGKKVAIKYVLKESADFVTPPGEVYKLPLEVVLLRLVCKPPRCPYVIELLEWFDINVGFIFILEQPESSHTLYDYCNSLKGKLPEAEAKNIMKQLVQAAHHCHSRGVFHSDIKLDNIIMNTQTTEVKLIDFGYGYMCKDITPKDFGVFHLSSSFVLPPHWINPDEERAERIIARDLGLLLLHLLGRKKPSFFGVNQTLAKEDLCEASFNLIKWCLEMDPKCRPTLKQILTHEWFQESHELMQVTK